MWRLLVSGVVSLVLGTAAAAQTLSSPQVGAAYLPTSSTDAARPSTGLDYKLGAGDKVRVIVYGETDMSGEFLVPSDKGMISFPLIGDVQAGGLDVGQLQDEIEAKLRDGYLKDPRVSIEVLNYRPFYILGEVTKPGQYPYTTGLTVLNAVATANGFTYRADTKHVFVRHANDATDMELPLTSETPVAPGDTIRIKERFF